MRIQQVAFFMDMLKLTLKQKLFCQFYIENFGNGTKAVVKAGYAVEKEGKVNRNLAKSIASENLTKPDIRKYIDELLQVNGFNDESVRLHHLNLISQSKNLSIKAKAIDMFYKLQGAYKVDKNQEEANQNSEKMWERLNRLLPDAEL